jgi:hypothetical protein
MTTPRANKVLVSLVDIRTIVGALLAIYGVLLTIAGFVPGALRDHDNRAAAADRVDLYVGTDANWWVGLILIGIAAVFFTWAFLRPVPVQEVERAIEAEAEGSAG